MSFDAGLLAYLLPRASALKNLDHTMAIVSQDEGSVPALHVRDPQPAPATISSRVTSVTLLEYRDYLSVLDDLSRTTAFPQNLRPLYRHGTF